MFAAIPTETHFEGPQNKRRYDFWQRAMEVVVTYGPDINVSLPTVLQAKLDIKDLLAKVNYYLASSISVLVTRAAAIAHYCLVPDDDPRKKNTHVFLTDGDEATPQSNSYDLIISVDASPL